MQGRFSSVFRILLLFLLSFTLHLGAEPADPTNLPSVRLAGHVPSKVTANAVLLGNLDAAAHVPVTFVLPLRNQAELEDLVKRIHDPADEQHYGKYLTSEEFVERFSPTQADYDSVIAYAKGLGLAIANTHPNRTLLNATGSAASLETAFNLQLHQYQTANGRKFYAPNANPEVPASIATIISGVVGLDNHAVWRPLRWQKPETGELQALNAAPNAFPSGPGGGYAPNDIVTAYGLSGVSANGSGQIVALFELAGYQASDINAYTSHFGLPTAQLHNVLVDGGSTSGIDAEVTLDIELALALAPNSQIYVYEGPNSSQGVLDTYNRIATDNIARQVSTSWGLGENLESSQFLQAENSIFLQMAAHGQTIYAAAGDSGAYDDYPSTTPAVDDPASQPYIVGVGGTRLAVNSVNGAYASEVVWNNGLGNGAGGGGVSGFWPIPTWQANVPTVYSQTHRNVPDVALNADPYTGYSIYYNGQWVIYGGTSCAAPLWAAFTARVNQQRAANSLSPLGFANPPLYAIASGASYAADFHDVTTGNNLVYSAHVGYDNATGWGSFNGINLFDNLTNSSPTPPPPPPPSLAPVLNISMAPVTPFIKGGTGTYQINVSNGGNAPTSGTVTVTVVLPGGLSYKSFEGAGWRFNRRSLTFTRSNILQPGASYPPIKLRVNVGRYVPSILTSTAIVSGGGSVSSSVSTQTNITAHGR